LTANNRFSLTASGITTCIHNDDNDQGSVERDTIMPPADAYAGAGGGGKLRLKGAKVQDGRVEKKGKKKKKQKDKPSEERDGSADNRGSERIGSEDRGTGEGDDESGREEGGIMGKTESERRYAEAKKKRVCAVVGSPMEFFTFFVFAYFPFPLPLFLPLGLISRNVPS
jgi:protein FAM32A